jgi:hypothetical protein
MSDELPVWPYRVQRPTQFTIARRTRTAERLRYVLGVAEGRTYRESGVVLGVATSRATQLIRKAQMWMSRGWL